MTDNRPITRRDSLKRIATTGAVLGGSGFALGSSSASADEHEKQIRLVAICYEKERSKFRVDNEHKKEVEVTWNVYGTDQSGTMTVPARDSTYFWVDAHKGDATVTLHYKDEQIDVKHANDQKKCKPDPKEALSLEPVCYVDGKHSEYEHGEAKFRITNHHWHKMQVTWKNYYNKQYGVRTIMPGESRYVWVKLDRKGKAKVGLYYDGKKVHQAKANTEDKCQPDPDQIRLVGICYEKHRSKFRVDNHNRQPVSVTWNAYGTDQSGEVDVKGNDSTYFWVDAYKGDVTVTLHYEDEQIDVKHANDQKQCEHDPKEVIELEPICYEGDNGKEKKHGRAKYRVTNHGHKNMELVWKHRYRYQKGTITVPKHSSQYLWVKLDKKGKARIGLYYDGKLLTEADANTDVVCEKNDHDNDNGYNGDNNNGDNGNDMPNAP
ncbi:hypothetical protein OB919_20415 [Halobacteria archaeon AArc-curdl1]|uniref:Uncharacterized protein n=1 Tax=Natronosalvus hydrolyticus TaxID=2979988 RepID=A0AAP2ZBU8_9EURY|nr:hypothetical protein [Halobacteria archaeon AArc-curdl1]